MAGVSWGRCGAQPCARACVPVHVCVRRLGLVELPSSKLAWAEPPDSRPQTEAPTRGGGGGEWGAEETLGVGAWPGLGGRPVTRPWGEVGASGQVSREYTLTQLTYTQRSTLRDTHTEHNTHTRYTPTNKIQTHNT